MERSIFRKTIYAHFKKEMRVFPWRNLPAGRQGQRDPYRVFVSEVMLQQTQTSRVVAKYEAWIMAFPDFKALANASPAKVLRLWQGLGYNRRALALKRAAEIVMRKHGGKLPKDEQKLVALPGIGPYTARAVLAFAHNVPVLLVETNIRTVYIHFFFKNKKAVHDKELLPLIERTLDRKNPREWYFALMDYGVFLKKTENFSRHSAHYKKQTPFKGSHRETRGEIVRLLLEKKKIPARSLPRLLKKDKKNVARAASELVNEGIIKKEKGILIL